MVHQNQNGDSHEDPTFLEAAGEIIKLIVKRHLEDFTWSDHIAAANVYALCDIAESLRHIAGHLCENDPSTQDVEGN